MNLTHDDVLILRTVVATLRSVASWTDWEKEELYLIAEEVEICFDALCCPVCDEETCSVNCPLAPIRGRK